MSSADPVTVGVRPDGVGLPVGTVRGCVTASCLGIWVAGATGLVARHFVGIILRVASGVRAGVRVLLTAFVTICRYCSLVLGAIMLVDVMTIGLQIYVQIFVDACDSNLRMGVMGYLLSHCPLTIN